MDSLNEQKTSEKYPMVGIIGTAEGHSENIIEKTKEIIENEWHLDPSKIRLVSGGAAFSEHVAVRLFLEKYARSLTIHLPCGWNTQYDRFTDNGNFSSEINPGKLLNRYHRENNMLSSLTLDEIKDAVSLGAIVKHHTGFHARNSAIAENADYLICFFWSEVDDSIGNGVFDTWNKCIGVKTKVDLKSLE